MTNETNLPADSEQTVRPRVRRRRRLLASFMVFVVLPTIIGTIYTTWIASNRYVSSAGFTIRSMKASAGTDFLGAFTGLAGGGSTSSDAYIVLRYMESRDLLRRLEERMDFRAVYGSDEVDRLSRLDTRLDIEHVVKYWKRRIHSDFDSTSGIINFEVQAFSPEASLIVAQEVLDCVQELVNDLSEKAREDAVEYAEEAVDRAETRLSEVLRSLGAFREREKALDPSVSAMAQIELLTSLEKKLLEIRARMTVLEASVDDHAPSLSALRRQADACLLYTSDAADDVSTV